MNTRIYVTPVGAIYTHLHNMPTQTTSSFNVHVVFYNGVGRSFVHTGLSKLQRQFLSSEVHAWTTGGTSVSRATLSDSTDGDALLHMPNCCGHELHIQVLSPVQGSTGVLVKTFTGHATIAMQNLMTLTPGTTVKAQLMSVASSSSHEYGHVEVSLIGRGGSPPRYAEANLVVDWGTMEQFRDGGYRHNSGLYAIDPIKRFNWIGETIEGQSEFHDVFFGNVAGTRIATCMVLNTAMADISASRRALSRMITITSERTGYSLQVLADSMDFNAQGEYLAMFWNGLVNLNTYLMDWDFVGGKRGNRRDVEKVQSNVSSGAAADCEDYALFVTRQHAALIRHEWSHETDADIATLASIARMYVPVAVLGTATNNRMQATDSAGNPSQFFGHCYAQLVPVALFRAQLPPDYTLDPSVSWKLPPSKTPLQVQVIEGTALVQPLFHAGHLSKRMGVVEGGMMEFKSKLPTDIARRLKFYSTTDAFKFYAYHIIPLLPGLVRAPNGDMVFEFTPMQRDVESRQASSVYGLPFTESVSADVERPVFALRPKIAIAKHALIPLRNHLSMLYPMTGMDTHELTPDQQRLISSMWNDVFASASIDTQSLTGAFHTYNAQLYVSNFNALDEGFARHLAKSLAEAGVGAVKLELEHVNCPLFGMRLAFSV